jgi:hypothetical protein
VLAADGQRVHSAGVRWTLGGARKVVADQRVLLSGAGRLRAKILGPTLAAGFYRREVLLALGGFEEHLGQSLADVAAALAIAELGHLHHCEPASRLVESESPAAANSHGFAASRAAEQLFWRYARQRGLPLSLGFHAASVLVNALRQAPRVTAATSLLGRAAAWCEFGAVRQHHERLAHAAEHLDTLASERSVIRLPSNTAAADQPTGRRKAA